MLKRTLSLLMMVVLIGAICLDAEAFEIKAVNKYSYLSFSGTTATCSTEISASGKTIHVVMELWKGSSRVGRWEATAASHLNLTRTCAVSFGKTYTLKVSGTIGSTAFTLPNITKKCG